MSAGKSIPPVAEYGLLVSRTAPPPSDALMLNTPALGFAPKAHRIRVPPRKPRLTIHAARRSAGWIWRHKLIKVRPTWVDSCRLEETVVRAETVGKDADGMTNEQRAAVW